MVAEGKEKESGAGFQGRILTPAPNKKPLLPAKRGEISPKKRNFAH
jgi:hypothetical protein